MNENRFYTLDETIKIIKSKEKLVYVDDGLNEYVIKYKDLPDYIVSNFYESEFKDLKIYKYPSDSMTPIATTMGLYLDKCNPDVRADIIDRLVELQMGDEDTNTVKVIDEYVLEEANEICEKQNNKKRDRER